MPIGNVTVDWEIRHPITRAAATGRVRIHVPRVLLATTDHVIYGPGPSEWVALDVDGKGSVTFPDPHDVGITPQAWAPVIEAETSVWNARYAISIPPGSAGETLHLDELSAVVDEIEGTAYALVSHTHAGGGGGGGVVSVNGETGVVTIDAADVGAPPTSRQVSAGTGLTGGGTLAADRTIALNATSIASLIKADTATQPAQLAAVAATIPNSPDDIGAAPVAHTHPISDVTSLQATLDGKAASAHTHAIANVTGLQAALDAKAATAHSHAIADTTGLQAALDAKAATVHGHAIADVTSLQSTLDGKVPLTLVDAAGDLLVGSGADTLIRLAKGTDGQLLGVTAGALDWVDAPAGGGSSIDPIARTYGCKAITMDPLDLSAGALKFIAMSNQRLYQYKVPIPAGELITGVRLPVKDAGAGAGQLHFAVYQEDLTQLGTTGNVAATFAGAVAEDWVDVPLTAADEATGDFVWIVALSTMDTGPQMVFANTDNAGEYGWLLNPAGLATSMRTEGVTVLPSTLSPEDETGYLDAVLGVY